MAKKKTQVYEVAVCNYMEYRPYVEASSEEEARIYSQFLFEKDALYDGEEREIDEYFGADVMNSEDIDNFDMEDENFYSTSRIKELGLTPKTKKRIEAELKEHDLMWTFNGCIVARYRAAQKMKDAKGKAKARYTALYEELDAEVKIIQKELSAMHNEQK